MKLNERKSNGHHLWNRFCQLRKTGAIGIAIPHVVLALLLILPVLLQNCAQVAQPPGGKKDTLAPKLITSLPAERQLNYTGKIVELDFNEYVKGENLQQKITITPQDSNTFVVKELPMGIRLTFNKPFRPNTTYTIDFADGIKDITERNIARNTKVVFSTGAVIDSLYLTGNVIDDETRQPILNFMVGLFDENDTLPITRKRPSYFDRTDSSGNFRIENVKAGRYKVYGFDDKDLNLANNTPGERVAFRDSILNLNRDITDVNMVAFRGYGKPRISRRERTDETLGLELSSGIASYKMLFGKTAFVSAANDSVVTVPATPAPTVAPPTPPKTAKSADDTLVSFLESAKMIRIYRPANRAADDTLHITIMAEDSVGNVTELRERVYFSPLKTKAKNRTALSVKVDPPTGEAIDNYLDFKLVFNKPVLRYDPALIIIGPDSTKPFKLAAEDLKWTNNYSRLEIARKTNLKDTLLFRLQKGAFISVQGDTLPKYSAKYKFAEEDSYGLLAGRIAPATVSAVGKKFIVELLDEKYNVLRSSYGTEAYTFGRLKPGMYRIRVILDANGNRKRDIGNVIKGIQPERIVYAPGTEENGTIRVKQNFELTDIDF